MQPPVYLRPPPKWEDHEKPALPGSPSMPYHPPLVRLCYGLVALLVGLTGGLGNALFTANLPTIQGEMGLTAAEAAWLTGAYVMFNMTANLLVYKFRQQFGMQLFTEIGLGAYALLTLLHLVLGSFESLVLLRAASGFAAAACTTLGTLYMLQSLPRKHVLKMLVVGVSLGQLATPLAWVLSPSLLFNTDWHNLYWFEAGLAVMSFAAVVSLKLPPGVFIKSFEKLDFLTFLLIVPGAGLLTAVLVQGNIRWWTDTPWLGWMLIGAIVLLSTAFYIEHHRPNPLLHTRWFTQGATIRFVIGALILRFLTTEQSYGVINLMRSLGMGVEQMQPLFWVILAGTLTGMAGSAITCGREKMGQQILVSIVLFALATLLDVRHSSVDRPMDFAISQFLMAVGAGIFMGPLMLLGIVQGLKNGQHFMITSIVTISFTQALGALLGATALNYYQIHREHVYSAQITAQVQSTHPLVADRLQQQAQALAPVMTDPTQRSAQATAQLAAAARREANVRAYNDVFALTASVAVLYLLWSLALSGAARKAAAQLKARAGVSAAAAGTNGQPAAAKS